jgi:N-acetylmuramoyl-L-alanine amidase
VNPGAPTRAVAVLALLALVAPVAAAARPARSEKASRANRSTTRTAAAATGRPDAALYQEAQRAQATLQASPKRQAALDEWEQVVLRYRKLVARYPRSGYCDNALLAIGDLYRTMASRFRRPVYAEDALDSYRTLVSEYPSSRLGEQALFSIFEMAQAAGDRRRLADAGKAYLAAYPDAQRAATVKAKLKEKAPAQAAALPKAPPPGLAQVFDLRFWSGDASTRIVIDVERKVEFKYDRIANPDRLWVDLVGTRLHPNFEHRSFPVGDGLLEKIRIGQNRDNVVRVVVDFKDVKDANVLYLEDPTRLVIDVKGTPRPGVKEASDPAASRPAAPAIPDRRVPAVVAEASTTAPPILTPPAAPSAEPPPRMATTPPSNAPTASPSPAPAPPDADRLSVRRMTAMVPADPAPAPRKTPAPFVIEGAERPRRGPAVAAAPTPAPSPSPAVAPTSLGLSAPLPPDTNRAGTYSLARQLGLGARRIVIDAGHGGHDPGTIGRAGLQEKDLVLDVAVRLEAMVRQELGAEVVMTRSSDVFIPLEERTAIANAKGADLFLSVHANSSRNPTARGIETYFLNFAANPHAEAVAARENAISPATLKDLQGLVKAITLNSKIDESRDFAASVQDAMVTQLRPRFDVLDRGVHTAPFYVLIGANMPSILAEIAFVSHPDEEKRLKTPEYRDAIARSLLKGVKAYIESLNRTQTRQLTVPPRRTTVVDRGGRR